MASQTKLIEWILLHADDLSVEISTLDWLKDVLPGVVDVMIQIKVNEKTFVGFGASENEDLAMVKAFAEAVERTAVQSHGIKTSNGCAAHVDPDKAKIAALNELIERDLILCHFHTNSPFVPLTQHKWGGLGKLAEWYKANHIEFGIFELGRTGSLFVADGRRANQPFGFVLGAGMKESLEQSLLASAIEATRQVTQFLAVPQSAEGCTLEQFAALQKPLFSDHGRLALDLDYTNKVAHLFKEQGFRGNVSDFSPNFRELDMRDEVLQHCPLRIFQASSDISQGMYLGLPSTETLNRNRLDEFVGRKLEGIELLMIPHPFN